MDPSIKLVLNLICVFSVCVWVWVFSDCPHEEALRRSMFDMGGKQSSLSELENGMFLQACEANLEEQGGRHADVLDAAHGTVRSLGDIRTRDGLNQAADVASDRT